MLITKNEYVTEVNTMLESVRTHFSENKGRVILGHTGSTYPERVAQLESFARPLLAFGPLLAGGKDWSELATTYCQGITAGTDPNNADYWGKCEDKDQRFVEMVSIAIAMLLTPDKLWEPLTEQAKNNLITWLSQINVYELNTNNWQFFRILVNVLFKRLGRPEFSQESINISLQNINSYYLGNGWYSDGPQGSKDYYIAFAFHYYGLIYAHFMKDDDPLTCQLFRERASLFALDFQYWFDETGEAIPYGRSLTYRMAQAAFFSACIYDGLEVLPMNVMKGILFRNVSKWLQSNIYDNGHILGIGYKYTNLNMAENYNAPGSPYWAFKCFLFLALNDDDNFWTIEPADMPSLLSVKHLNEANMIITRSSGNVVCYPCPPGRSGTSIGHAQEKYSKFAYSTKFGFSVHKENNSLANMAPDSELVFEINSYYYSHSVIRESSVISDNTIRLVWSPYDGIEVTTTIVCETNRQERTHIIQSNIECTAYDVGFSADIEAEAYSSEVTETSALVTNDAGYCRVSGSMGQIITASPNSSLFFPRSAMPCVKYMIGIGTQTLTTTVEFE